MRLWDSIRLLRKSIISQYTLPSCIGVSAINHKEISFDSIDKAEIIIHLKNDRVGKDPLSEEYCEIECRCKEITDDDLRSFRFYLPYVFMGWEGRKQTKCFAISHFAQTLDGRIATSTGDSKWIGNEENLLHAHRMRALCDAILVGSKTVEKDNPKLTVRLVKGIDPVRVVIGNSKLSDQEHHAIDESTIVFRESSKDEPFDCVVLKKDPYFDLKSVLKLLVERDLFSVYIEGGSFTTSRFLEQQALDQIQIHFSAKILGSGTNSFGFGEVGSISECITFKESKFIPIGDEMMFIGNL